MPKKIFFYTDTPIAGGAEKHMHLLAKNLLKDGYAIKIICSNDKSLDTWCESMKKDGLEILRLKVKHKHDPRHLSQLKKILKQEPPNILHLHLWNPGACRYAFFAIDPSKTKIITTEHDPFPLSGLKKIFKKKMLLKTTHTITVSEHNANKMREWYPKEIKKNICTIQNGIDLESFEKEITHFSNQEKQKIRTQLFEASTENKVILSIAALHPRKGLLYLIEAFAEVHATEPKTKLILLGEGPQKKILEAKIKELQLEKSILILPHHDEIPKILKCSDIFVLASVKEAFGLVLLEALAAQIPIIASEVGGIPEIIENKKSGILVEPAKPKQLAREILNMLRNKAFCEKLVFNGFHQVRNFSVQAMVKKTETLYDTV